MKLLFFLGMTLYVSVFPWVGHAVRGYVKMVGSSALYPLMALLAEQFSHDSLYPPPIIEATGTGGGIRLFCAGEGEAYPDMVSVSRLMTEEEKIDCKKHGVHGLGKVMIGLDGIVLTYAHPTLRFDLTSQHVFLALAYYVPYQETLIKNPYHQWNEIDAALPAVPIHIYAPPHAAGTRDFFASHFMQENCKQFPAYQQAIISSEERDKICALIREDKHFVETTENDQLLLSKLQSHNTALAISTFQFYAHYRPYLQVVTLDGIMPSHPSIQSGSYPIVRPLWVYAKRKGPVAAGYKEWYDFIQHIPRKSLERAGLVSAY